jgi:hypothetical protein
MHPVTVQLPNDLLTFVQRTAERETRPVSLQIRHFIAEAARRAGNQPDAMTSISGLPPLPIGEEAQRAELAELEPELERYEAMAKREGWKLLPQHEAKLRQLRDRVTSLKQQLAPYERSNGHG